MRMWLSHMLDVTELVPPLIAAGSEELPRFTARLLRTVRSTR